jgi:hypothetical protein
VGYVKRKRMIVHRAAAHRTSKNQIQVAKVSEARWERRFDKQWWIIQGEIWCYDGDPLFWILPAWVGPYYTFWDAWAAKCKGDEMGWPE